MVCSTIALMDEQKPGQVISPGVVPASAPAEQPIASSAQPSSDPLPPAAAQPPEAVSQQQPAMPIVDEPVETPPYAAAMPETADPEDSFTWEAHEDVVLSKSGGWYALLIAVSIVISAAAYLLTRDIVSSIAVCIGLVGLIYFALRRPNLQQYAIDSQGIYISKRLYPFANYKGFSVVEERTHITVSLTPLKRFMPPLIVNVDPQTEDGVLDVLRSFLPEEDHKPDAIDSIMRRLRT